MTPLISRAVRTLGAVVLLGILAAPAHASDAAFSSRFAQTLHGNISAVGNTLMTCPSSAACTAAQNGTSSGDALNNNSYTMARVDVDGDASTFDSSSSTVSLPAGSTVVWAGLYWSADTTAGSGGSAAPTPASNGTVKFKVPGGAYQSISAASANVLTSSLRSTRYRAFKDVTSLIPATGTGTYWVANVQAGSGADRYAGWSLFIAYRNDAQTMRRLNVYDGLGTVDDSHTWTTTIAPFHTPVTGPVTTKVGLLSFEGDGGLTGETATFNGHALTDALNPVANPINSTIESGGTRFSSKSPDYVNQLGMDLDTLVNGGALGNDQTSAPLTFSSTADYFMPSALFVTSDEAPPSNTGAPSVGGTPQDGKVLTANPGDWNGTNPIDYDYQWQRCDAAGNNCVNIPGATGSTYTPGAGDVGGTIRVIVTASNDAGSSSPVTSPASGIVLPAAPANTGVPTITGTPAQGSVLTANPGTWTGAGPITKTYQWQRCDSDGAHCVDIAGATGSTYTPGADDAGHTIRVIVTGTNAGGSTSKPSDPTAVVPAVVPNTGGGGGSGGGSGDGNGNGGTGTGTGTTTDTTTATTDTPGIGVLGEASCQQLVGGAKYRRVAFAGVGTVRVRAYTSGPALDSSPVRLTTEITGGRAKSVRYVFDGRAIAAGRKAQKYAGVLTPRQLGKVGLHKLTTTVRGARGRSHTVALTLQTVPCQTLFTAQRWRTTAGAGLRLRIDSRTALTGLRFGVPAALLPKQTAQPRPAGFIRLYISGRSTPVRYNLALPKRGAKAVLLGAVGKPTVTRTRTGLRVANLPAKTAVAELTLYRVTKLDRATPRRAYTIKATVTRAGAAATSFRAKPKAPR
jgi:hypothetical protein